MKKIVQLCAAILALTAIFALTGCSARTPITADEFSKQATAAGFAVQEESAASNLDVDKLISATKSEAGTEILFVSVKTDAAAEDMYKSIKASISKDTSGSSSTLDSSTYSKYTLTNGELNHTLVRMNKTIVYGKANTPVKDQVDSFFKSINY